MMVNFHENLYKESFSFKPETPGGIALESARGGILGSDQISGMEIRLSHVMVKDNKTPKIFPFPGLAKVYFMNVVVSDIGTDEISITLKGFEKVDDGDSLAVDRTLFYWKQDAGNVKAPSQIHVMSSIIKSKKDLRDVAAIMAEVKEDEAYKGLTSALANIVTDATAAGNISDLVLTLSGIVGKYLGKVEDKPLLTWFQSFTDMDGDWDVIGKTSRHAENRYASMSLSLTIRDKERMTSINED